MGWNKQYDHKKPYARVLCIKAARMLYTKSWYNVIDESPTKYLIQFNSGGAKWYAKNRFVGEHKF